jgi:hypothetical protein
MISRKKPTQKRVGNRAQFAKKPNALTSHIPQLVGEWTYLATTDCGCQEKFEEKVTKAFFTNKDAGF